MTSGESILWGVQLDYSARGTGAPSYVTGGAITPTSALGIFEANIGKRCSIVHITGGWTSNGVFNQFSKYTPALNIFTAAGRMPSMEWFTYDSGVSSNMQSINCDAIIAGTWDNYIRTFATDIKNWGKDVLIRVFTEPNLIGQYPWQYGPTGSWTIDGTAGHTFPGYRSGTWTNTVAKTNQALARIGDIFKNQIGCFNGKLVWNPNFQGSGATLTFAQQYVGLAGFVDVLSWDAYTGTTNGVQATLGQIYRGGVGQGLQDTYGLIAALDPDLPLMVCETGFWGTVGGLVNIQSILRSGGQWTITTASPVAAEAIATCSFDIAATQPSGYQGEWPIVTRNSSTSFVVAGDIDHGAITTLGHVQVIDRVNRAANVTQSLEIDVPAMPRLKYFQLFWVNYNASQWVMDYDGSQPNNVDMLALRKAIGNAHYLAGGQMGTDTSTVPIVPYQDQALTAVGARERYRGVCQSTSGLVGAWLLRDTVGTSPVADDSGFGRTGVVSGQTVLGAANVLPSQPSWTSAQFPGNTVSAITVAHSTAFNPGTTGLLSVETSFVLPTTPVSNAVLVAKGSASNYVWSLFAGPTSIGFTLYQIDGTSYSFTSHNLPTLGVSHHVVASVDLSVTSSPITFYLDNVPHFSGAAAGIIGNSTAPVTFGLRGDALLAMVANGRLGPVWIYNTAMSVESVADHYSAWIAAPVVSSLVVN